MNSLRLGKNARFIHIAIILNKKEAIWGTLSCEELFKLADAERWT